MREKERERVKGGEQQGKLTDSQQEDKVRPCIALGGRLRTQQQKVKPFIKRAFHR